MAFDDATNFVLPALTTLLSDDTETLGLKHLSVAEGHEGGYFTMEMDDGDYMESDDDDDYHHERHEKKRWGGKRGKKQLHCHGKRDMSAACINTYFTELANNNEWEWVMAIKSMWWTKAILAIFGPITIPWAFIAGWVILLFPGTKPDIDTIDEYSWEEYPITSMWQMSVSAIGMLSTAGLFMFTQLFTWGESDLRDFAIIYMDSTEAFLYLMINTFWQSMMYIPAMMWFSCTFWIYGLEIMFKVFMMFIDWDDDWKEERRGRYHDDDDHHFDEDHHVEYDEYDLEHMNYMEENMQDFEHDM